MDLERFWKIVEETRPTAAEDPDGFDEALTATLSSLTAEEVLDFDATWDAVARQALTWDVWAAAWVLRGGCDDWAFQGFRDRLIALGRSAFEQALRDPDALADLDVTWDSGEDEDVWISLATAEAYERLTGSELSEAESEEDAEPQEPEGERWDLQTVVERVPRLAAKVSYDASRVRLRHPCPCCGNLTIEEPGSYDICEVCWWEDGELDREQPDEISGPNRLPLDEARKNYARFGACDDRHRDDARPPRPWEVPRRRPG